MNHSCFVLLLQNLSTSLGSGWKRELPAEAGSCQNQSTEPEVFVWFPAVDHAAHGVTQHTALPLSRADRPCLSRRLFMLQRPYSAFEAGALILPPRIHVPSRSPTNSMSRGRRRCWIFGRKTKTAGPLRNQRLLRNRVACWTPANEITGRPFGLTDATAVKL